MCVFRGASSAVVVDAVMTAYLQVPPTFEALCIRFM